MAMMSSVNPFYTFQYSQPAEYHFSHDSVFLARMVFESLDKQQIAGIKGLDLCAGCGVIGMDFIFHCRQTEKAVPQSFDFVEVQEVYKEHFARNQQTLGEVGTHIRLKIQNYRQMAMTKTGAYNLILCNPPYFHLGHGKLSPSEFKNRCRFFIDSDYRTLLLAIENSLSQDGSAYLLLRDLSEHGFNALNEARKILSENTKIEKIGDIRGTGLVRIFFG